MGQKIYIANILYLNPAEMETDTEGAGRNTGAVTIVLAAKLKPK